MSVMIGGVTERLAPDSNFLEPGGFNDSFTINVTLRDEARVRVAAAVTILSGIFQVHYCSCSEKKTYWSKIGFGLTYTPFLYTFAHLTFPLRVFVCVRGLLWGFFLAPLSVIFLFFPALKWTLLACRLLLAWSSLVLWWPTCRSHWCEVTPRVLPSTSSFPNSSTPLASTRSDTPDPFHSFT